MHTGFLEKFGLAAVLASAVIATSCGDTFRPVAAPITAPSGDPSLTHSMFVVSANAPAAAGSVSQVDVSGDSNVGAIRASVGPVHAGFSPPGQSQVFVANRDDDTVTSYFPSVGSIPPTTIKLSPGVHHAPVYVASTNSSKMFVAEAATNSIGMISSGAHTLLSEIAVGTTPVALVGTADGKKIYSINQASNDLSAIDVASGTVLTTFAVGTSPVWGQLSPDGLAIYILNQGSNDISVVDTTTDTVIATVPVGASPNYMFLNSKTNRLFVSNTGDNTISVLDVSKTIPTNLPPIAIPTAGLTAVTALGNGSRAYAVSFQGISGNNVVLALTVINAFSNTVSKTIDLTQPVATNCGSDTSILTGVRFRAFVAAAADSTKVYVSSCDAGTTTILKTSSNLKVAAMPSPRSAFPPPAPKAQSPPQNPVFIVAGP